jgi:hypothetical protein
MHRLVRLNLTYFSGLDSLWIYSCLDDEELDFLGASWPEYSQTARELGLDILR